MDPRRINLALWTTAATLAAGVPAALWYGLITPVESASPRPPTAVLLRPVAETRVALPPVDAFTSVVARTYRPPLVAGPADASAAAPDTNAPPSAAVGRLQLVGMVGDAVAMIRGPDGTTALVEVGDDVDGAAVVAIGPSRVDLKQDGRLTTLRKSPSPDAADLVVH